MGGNSHYWRDTLDIISNDTTGNRGTGNCYYSSGWIGKAKALNSGAVITALPIKGHIQTVYGLPVGGIQSGSYWFTLENQDNIILYQSAATASGTTCVVFPDKWYGLYTKFVCYSTTGGSFTFEGLITDV